MADPFTGPLDDAVLVREKRAIRELDIDVGPVGIRATAKSRSRVPPGGPKPNAKS